MFDRDVLEWFADGLVAELLVERNDVRSSVKLKLAEPTGDQSRLTFLQEFFANALALPRWVNGHLAELDRLRVFGPRHQDRHNFRWSDFGKFVPARDRKVPLPVLTVEFLGGQLQPERFAQHTMAKIQSRLVLR